MRNLRRLRSDFTPQNPHFKEKFGGDNIETNLTKAIKYMLVDYYTGLYEKLKEWGHSCIFVYKEEVFTSRNSFVDFAVSYIDCDLTEETVCCEIKISEDDFNSKYGSNFYGTKNYYVVPNYMTDWALDKIDNNALYSNIGLMEFGESDDGYYIEIKRWAKELPKNNVTYAIQNNLINDGTYLGEGRIELKKHTFRFFNDCNKYENRELLRNMIMTSNRATN